MGSVLGIRQQRWVAEKLGKMIRRRGEIVDDVQFEERKEKCRGCVHFGEVMPLPGLSFDEGCTLCGCPIETKARMKVLMRLQKNVGEALTAREIITSPLTGEHLFPDVVKCSNHKVNDFWEEVDKKYK